MPATIKKNAAGTAWFPVFGKVPGTSAAAVSGPACRTRTEAVQWCEKNGITYKFA